MSEENSGEDKLATHLAVCCENCRYFVPRGIGSSGLGECRRNSPHPILANPDDDGVMPECDTHEFPAVLEGMFCGDYHTKWLNLGELADVGDKDAARAIYLLIRPPPGLQAMPYLDARSMSSADARYLFGFKVPHASFLSITRESSDFDGGA